MTTIPEEVRGPRIALAGTLDLPRPATLLSARIHERELGARLPHAVFTRWAEASPARLHPLVAPAPPRALAEFAAEPADLVIVLGGWPGRALLLAGDHSALATAGPLGHEDEEALLDCFERSVPLSVRDAVSAARISALGPLDRVPIVPEPALLASRVFPVEV
ncbi:MAG: hypothetical protein JNK60_00500, partial [Acidobacteria bacterium]|nr:hypothetical protein [Acidobacteriota bacterium]